MNRVRWRRLLLFALLGAAALANAAEDAGRPRVALILGGGGARGAAHIGVLEVLEKLRIPVDCVAGTSMGALVAGVYAGGMSPAKMREDSPKLTGTTCSRTPRPTPSEVFATRCRTGASCPPRKPASAPMACGIRRGSSPARKSNSSSTNWSVTISASAGSRICRCRFRSSPQISSMASRWSSAAAACHRPCAPACRFPV
jgi:hypothetical protein